MIFITVKVSTPGVLVSTPTIPNKTTTVNTYVDAYVWDTAFLNKFVIKCAAATNNLKIKILGSIDGGATFSEDVVAETTVNASAVLVTKVTDYYSAIKVQVKPAAENTHGTLSIIATGRS